MTHVGVVLGVGTKHINKYCVVLTALNANFHCLYLTFCRLNANNSFKARLLSMDLISTAHVQLSTKIEMKSDGSNFHVLFISFIFECAGFKYQCRAWATRSLSAGQIPQLKELARDRLNYKFTLPDKCVFGLRVEILFSHKKQSTISISSGNDVLNTQQKEFQISSKSGIFSSDYLLALI